MKITEAQAKRIARTLVTTLRAEPACLDKLNDVKWVEHVLQRFSEGTEYGAQTAAEERKQQCMEVCAAVVSWMRRVYERSPRLENGETMELKILADQSHGIDDGNGDTFEGFSFRIETTTTEGEF